VPDPRRRMAISGHLQDTRTSADAARETGLPVATGMLAFANGPLADDSANARSLGAKHPRKADTRVPGADQVQSLSVIRTHPSAAADRFWRRWRYAVRLHRRRIESPILLLSSARSGGSTVLRLLMSGS
jgi:hypothetical protein